MKQILLYILFLTIISCENRKIVYSGMDDLFIGVYQIVLYENGEFYLDLGTGGTEGKFNIIQDTVNLIYYSKPALNWPNQFILTDKYFSSVALNDSDIVINITRQIIPKKNK